MRLIVVTFTYRRTHQLAHLLAQVALQRADATHLVFDDCTPEENHEWQLKRSLLDSVGISWWRQPERCGRKKHWKLVTDALLEIAKRPHDRVVFLPDDAILCNGFFDRVETLWSETIALDPTALTLNVLVESPRMWGPCWTNFVPEPSTHVMKTQWVDGAFYADSSFVKRVPHIRPTRYFPSRGSGVWQQVSEDANTFGDGLYQVFSSLVDLQSIPSEMRPGTEDRVVIGFEP